MPALSLEPEFRRSHGSLYKALERGRIDEDRLRALLVAQRPASWPLVFAVDASTWDRCDAECSPERGFYYSASKHSAGQPIVAGWNYQWICQLDWAFDSWTAPLDMERIPPEHDSATATAAQIRRLLRLLPGEGEVPLFVFDAGYNPIALGHDLAQERCECLTRIHDDRVFYADPPPRPRRLKGTDGHPPRHGGRFKCSDSKDLGATIGEPRCFGPRYGTVKVKAWHGLHPRVIGRGRWHDYGGAPPIVPGTVIRVEVERLPKPGSGTKKTLWLFWTGPGEPDLERERLVHFFVHRRCPSLGVRHFAVVAVVTSTSGATRRGEYGRRDSQTDDSDDHEDDPHGGQSESVRLRGRDSPVHDSTGRYGDRAEDHSGQTHFSYLPLVSLALGQV